MKLKASSFSGLVNDQELDRNAHIATLPANQLDELAPGATHYFDEIQVVWLATDTSQQPNDAWLSANFPSTEALVAATRDCVGRYASECPDSWLREVKQELTAGQLELFEKHGWLPFIYIERVLINSELNVVLVECMAEIDPNLQEHGVAIVLHEGEWRFGSGDDVYELFTGWSGEPYNSD